MELLALRRQILEGRAEQPKITASQCFGASGKWRAHDIEGLRKSK
jgi:hypothetical protein